MKALIKNGLIIDPVNSIKDKLDILIENSIVKEVKRNIKDDTENVIDAKGMIVSPGFVDLHANFCDPGVTLREDLKTGSLAAAKGGYTHVVLGTDNKPAPSECNVIEYIKKYANIMPINIYPSAALTNERAGFEMADISFLHNHGAIAYYDGLKPIEDKILLEKLMLAVKSINGILSIYSEKGKDGAEIKVRGVVDGVESKALGLKGVTPIDAEVNDLIENVELAKLIGCKLDLAYISSEESIKIVEEAKKAKQEIYAEVQALSLILNEKAIAKNGAYAKVLPPLRSESDRKALCKALKKNIIDVISSNHVPVATDDKKVKLKDAACGSIGLETVLGICGLKLVGDGVLNWKEVIEKISVNPAKIYGLDKDGAGSITEGKKANITIFNPDEKWELVEEEIASKSHNTPLLNVSLKGRVKYTICNGKLVYRDMRLVK